MSFYDVSCAVAKRVAEKYPSLTAGGVARRVRRWSGRRRAVHEAPELRRGLRRFEACGPKSKTPPRITRNVLAGVPTERFRAGLGLAESGTGDAEHARANRLRGDGVDRGRAQRATTDADVERCKGALGALGKEMRVEEESYVDMSTSISGSGPAYIFC